MTNTKDRKDGTASQVWGGVTRPNLHEESSGRTFRGGSNVDTQEADRAGTSVKEPVGSSR